MMFVFNSMQKFLLGIETYCVISDGELFKLWICKASYFTAKYQEEGLVGLGMGLTLNVNFITFSNLAINFTEMRNAQAQSCLCLYNTVVCPLLVSS